MQRRYILYKIHTITALTLRTRKTPPSCTDTFISSDTHSDTGIGPPCSSTLLRSSVSTPTWCFRPHASIRRRCTMSFEPDDDDVPFAPLPALSHPHVYTPGSRLQGRCRWSWTPNHSSPTRQTRRNTPAGLRV
jgi:hypothetical protein